MRNTRQTRVMVFGTFDLLHKGHEHFFKQARKLVKNPYLIVSVARDSNVKKIKGRKPLLSEQQRVADVKRSQYVNKVVLGGKIAFLTHIIKEQPDVIGLGYDQIAYTEMLQENLEKRGLRVVIKRLAAYKPHVYKSSLIKQKNKIM